MSPIPVRSTDHSRERTKDHPYRECLVEPKQPPNWVGPLRSGGQQRHIVGCIYDVDLHDVFHVKVRPSQMGRTESRELP